jgi:transcriptional regulator with XRE-family HTH domain
MKASEWIDRVKLSRGWDSDYRAAKELGLSRNTISNYRTRTPTLDEDTAIKVAAALGERPEAVLLDQYAERTRNPEVRSALLDAGRRLCILCKVPNGMDLLASAARALGIGLGMTA